MIHQPRRLASTDWSLQLVLLAMTVVVVLQNTKQALLPARQTPVLWGAELAVILGVVVLRSGWGRDNRWVAEQRRLGTLANDFYEPRREALLNGGAVTGGVLGGFLWGAATWAAVLFGMRGGVVARGLFDVEVAALIGALTGGIVGAVVGLAIGHVWEQRHRRNRYERQARHA